MEYRCGVCGDPQSGAPSGRLTRRACQGPADEFSMEPLMSFLERDPCLGEGRVKAARVSDAHGEEDILDLVAGVVPPRVER